MLNYLKSEGRGVAVDAASLSTRKNQRRLIFGHGGETARLRGADGAAVCAGTAQLPGRGVRAHVALDGLNYRGLQVSLGTHTQDLRQNAKKDGKFDGQHNYYLNLRVDCCVMAIDEARLQFTNTHPLSGFKSFPYISKMGFESITVVPT